MTAKNSTLPYTKNLKSTSIVIQLMPSSPSTLVLLIYDKKVVFLSNSQIISQFIIHYFEERQRDFQSLRRNHY